MSNVFYANIGFYDPDEIRIALEQGIKQLGGIRSICAGRTNLLLKPNFIQPDSPEVCSTTHPVFLLTVADFFQDYGYKVSIGESPAIGSVEACIEALNLKTELEKRNIRYFTFKKSRSFKTDGSGQYKSLAIAEELGDFDGIINLPKLKTHCQHRFTGATKNLYGCVPGKRKALRHMRSKNDLASFTQMILDNARQANPFLNIADGILAMHKHGPRKGEPFSLKTVLMSESYLSLDDVFCRIIGLDPQDTPLFKTAGLHIPKIVYGAPVEYATGFEHSPQIPIKFDLLKMLFSYLKTMRAGVLEKAAGFKKK